MKKDNYSYFCRDLNSSQSKENTNAEYRYPPAMTNLNPVYSPSLSISELGLNDFLSGELSVIKVKLASGVERFVCMDNDAKVYLSEEFTLDALLYNKELLACIPLVNDFVTKYDKENPDNKIILCGCMDLFISYASKTVLYK
jgi:hypothetical protein